MYFSSPNQQHSQNEQVAQLSQGAVVLWPKVDWNWRTTFMDIIGLYSTTVTYLASKAINFGEKTQNKGIRRSRSFKINEVDTDGKPECDFL